MIVRKLDAEGNEVWNYPAQVMEERPNVIKLEAFFNRDDMDLGYTTFKRNDRFIEYFYNDRWYNIFAVYDRDDGALKGWYCNICRPAVWGANDLNCEDLALDVWASPKGEVFVMDEDEFAALGLPEHDQQQALEALDALKKFVAQDALPR